MSPSGISFFHSASHWQSRIDFSTIMTHSQIYHPSSHLISWPESQVLKRPGHWSRAVSHLGSDFESHPDKARESPPCSFPHPESQSRPLRDLPPPSKSLIENIPLLREYLLPLSPVLFQKAHAPIKLQTAPLKKIYIYMYICALLYQTSIETQ